MRYSLVTLLTASTAFGGVQEVTYGQVIKMLDANNLLPL